LRLVWVNNFYEVGIRTKLHPIERAGFAAAYAGKKYTRGVLRGASGAFGNAATRLAAFAVTGGSNVYGSYPDIDALYSLQADELDPKKRAAVLEQMQRLVYERAVYAPLWQLAFLNGVGPRVGESSFGCIANFPYTATYEDVTIKSV
jgi:peptide/nickel transport system substrate-binding protein